MTVQAGFAAAVAPIAVVPDRAATIAIPAAVEPAATAKRRHVNLDMETSIGWGRPATRVRATAGLPVMCTVHPNLQVVNVR